MFLKGLLYFVIVSTQIGCAVELRERARRQGASAGSPLHLKIQGMKPHQYLALLQWPLGQNIGGVRINESTNLIPAQGLTQMSIELKDDQDVLIDLHETEDPKSKLIHRWALRTPKDFDTSDVDFLSSMEKTNLGFIIKGGRLFLGRKGIHSTSNIMPIKKMAPTGFYFDESTNIFYIGPHELIIDVNEVISEESTISTFPNGAKALLNKRGSNGGSILLRTQTGRGSLQFLMRGEHGGDRIFRIDHPILYPPLQGGDTGSVRIEIADTKSALKVDIKNDPGQPGRTRWGKYFLKKEAEVMGSGQVGPHCISRGEGFGRCSR